MSGKGYLLDTNAIIQFLKGNKGLVDILALKTSWKVQLFVPDPPRM